MSPRGCVKIRPFGLVTPANVKSRLAVARDLLVPAPDVRASLAAAPAIAAPVAIAGNTGEFRPARDSHVLFRQLTGIDLGRCRVCGQGNLVRLLLPVGASQPRLARSRANAWVSRRDRVLAPSQTPNVLAPRS
jgi:hypothetical protein